MDQSTASHSIGETCIVCEQLKKQGIRIYTKFLCIDCEREIVQTDVHDPRYQFYLQQLRKIMNREIYS
nr:sigma factor G inhibitor Gin [Anoxybacillus tepidamans]